jgi:ABC-type transport system involved in cytochrome c biogenesis, permease component
LILFLMYLGLIALWRAVEDPSRAARAAAILTLVGATQSADHQILGRLVEHAASAGLGDADGRPRSTRLPDSAFW